MAQPLPLLVPQPLYYDVKAVPSQFWGTPVMIWQNSSQAGPGGIGYGELYCPGYHGPTFSQNKWDFVIVGDYATPGVCEVSAGKERGYKVNDPKGADGGRVITYGLKVATIELRITIWTPQQLEELRKLWSIVFPGRTKTTTTTSTVLGARTTTTVRPSGTTTSQNADGSFSVQRNYSTVTTPQVGSTQTHKVTRSTHTNVSEPFVVIHPALAMHNIHAVTFVKGEGPAPGKSQGAKIFTMTGIEYLPPGTKNVTNSASPAPPRRSTLESDTPGNVAGNTDP